MQRKADYVNSELGEDMVLDKLIAMNDVPVLADKSDEFSNFLTVLRKYVMKECHAFTFFILFILLGKIAK